MKKQDEQNEDEGRRRNVLRNVFLEPHLTNPIHKHKPLKITIRGGEEEK